MKQFLSVAIVTVFFLLFTAASYSQAMQDHICFKKVDADQNGEVTYSEFKKIFEDGKEKFHRIDTDQNGVLTHDEYHKSLGHGADTYKANGETAQ